ncbi:Lrp/AsnC ligand binding domain-containing protein [Streptomyces sp. NPDC051658]|uniref:Lrp/AsnC ligand binding domain-containing protein n=1 Tax=Streptomyces sp. NPDC051658 TaxID=3365667 RepID=UPI0037B875E9
MLLVLLQGVVEAEVVEGGRRAGPGLREDLAVREGAVLPYVEGAADETCPGVGFAALPEILEAHVIAGSASMLVKVRTATTEQLQDVLRRIHAIDGVNGTRATVVLETLFERPVSPRAADQE